MGKIIKAQCKSCGFQSEDLYTGFGFKNAGDYYMTPAICPKCRSFALKDQRHPPQYCRRCKSEMAFYGSEDFSSKYFPDRLKAEPVAEDTAKGLLNGRHVCPSCGKVELTFEERGDWS
jgi:ribosomal protein L37AE/L43A